MLSHMQKVQKVGSTQQETAPLSQTDEKDTIVHQLSVPHQLQDMSLGKSLSILGLVVLLGIVSGYGLSYFNNARAGADSMGGGGGTTNDSEVKETAGIADKKTFKDSAEGELEEGGHESGEGSFKLVRPGGEDQTAYLTSSTVDLSAYVGKKVRVHGETFSSQHVGWLMDVGYVEVLE